MLSVALTLSGADPRVSHHHFIATPFSIGSGKEMSSIVSLVKSTTLTALRQETTHVFLWKSGAGIGHKLAIAGSWDGWQMHPLRRIDPLGYLHIKLVTGLVPNKVYYYLFLVDGQWTPDPSPTAEQLTDFDSNSNGRPPFNYFTAYPFPNNVFHFGFDLIRETYLSYSCTLDAVRREGLMYTIQSAILAAARVPHAIDVGAFDRWVDERLFQIYRPQGEIEESKMDFRTTQKYFHQAYLRIGKEITGLFEHHGIESIGVTPEKLGGKGQNETGDGLGTAKDVKIFLDSLNPTQRRETVQVYTWETKMIVKHETNTVVTYPPHCRLKSTEVQSSAVIFDTHRLIPTIEIVAATNPTKPNGPIIVDWLKNFGMKVVNIKNGAPANGHNLAQITEINHRLRKCKKNIYDEPNVGDLQNSWFSDEVFAHQQFNGVNPATLTRANDQWYNVFKKASGEQTNYSGDAFADSERDYLYVQDLSFFSEIEGITRNREGYFCSGEADEKKRRYAVASVALFHLETSGKLHPVAIVIDWKGDLKTADIKDSEIIFNKRNHSSVKHDQENDWPWRYAKTAHQTADWLRHEVGSHLVQTHFIEEATIVATQLGLDVNHPVFNILRDHWQTTLSINYGARTVLVPQVVLPLVGFPLEQLEKYLLWEYHHHFNWTEQYVPNDMKKRGFDSINAEINIGKVDKSNDRFHNYSYGRNIVKVWAVLRQFVEKTLLLSGRYPDDISVRDQVVKNDEQLKKWINELRGDNKGHIKSFPAKFDTFDELVDAVTMCIHIASSQHTAVNYLQKYYLSFVVARPPCLFSRPPAKGQLASYTEDDLLRALPLGEEHAGQWLLASHLPDLLSYKVSSEQSLLNYAQTLEVQSRMKTTEEHRVAQEFLNQLRTLGDDFVQISKQNDQLPVTHIAYDVLQPGLTANSILI
ncbi:lipoxygenase [Planoprotostelium fungivorum]|uniref:Lipoxygenase n=1 Tax=Planoprotostelium fungivorum TaxID=1890364 RepID=A0A2P6NCV4_9EUKA|nr:lipoxygenase [Planoprotostelium fungivorum]